MNNKLYTILRTFDKIEMNRLEKYILSPYFNKNQYTTQLFGLLMKNVESKNAKELVKEDVWKILFEKEKYDDVRFRKINSDLLKLVEGYLAQQLYDENPLHQAIYLMEAVTRKKLDKLHNSTVKAAEELSKKQQYRPSGYYFYQYQIERNLYMLSDLDTQRTSKTNLEKIINNLDYFYLAEKLRYYVDILQRQSVVSHEYQLLFIDEILEHLGKQNYENVAAVSVYYQIYLTLKEPENENHFDTLMELLEKDASAFPESEANLLYKAALNYCVAKVNKGNQHFLENLFNIYIALINNKLLFIGDSFNTVVFSNIIYTALRLEKYQWAIDFVEKYQDKLPFENRESTVNFNFARIYFRMKKFDKVIPLLSVSEFPDYLMTLNAKVTLAGAYYELDELTPLYSLLESVKIYLSRHKDISPQRKELFSNFIKFTRKLTELIPRDKKAIQKLREELNNTKNITNADWLHEKLNALER